MSDSIDIQVIEALAGMLTPAVLGGTNQAAAAFLPSFDLEQLEGLRVTVLPSAIEFTEATRGSEFEDVSIDVGVQQRCAPDDLPALKTLRSLCQDILDFLRAPANRRLPTSPQTNLMTIANRPVYDPKHLNEKRVFTSVIRATYRCQR